MQYDKLLWRMAMWIRRPPSKKQLMMWGDILGFSVLLAGLERYDMWPESWNLERHQNKMQMTPIKQP
jgi:hypothetical protein